MSTYNHKQVLTDYANGTITPEMAVGHTLQHVDQLYDLLKVHKQEWQYKIDALEKSVQQMQGAINRLTAILEKARVKNKPAISHNSQADQP